VDSPGTPQDAAGGEGVGPVGEAVRPAHDPLAGFWRGKAGVFRDGAAGSAEFGGRYSDAPSAAAGCVAASATVVFGSLAAVFCIKTKKTLKTLDCRRSLLHTERALRRVAPI
jgi:hypothetical protein